jgi:catechol 2,3-dioxygenase-like lactoylglutathione lyase family enzyme
MAVELLAPSIEIGLVTTNLDAMVAFYEGFLGLPHQGDLGFPGGEMKRYGVGNNVVIKLVTLDEPPAAPVAPGGGPAQAGIRYITLVVKNLTTTAEQVADAGYQAVQPLAEFAPVPGMGWMFVADPDGNWVELVGPL